MDNIGLYLSRILSGYYIINYNNCSYKIIYPDISVKYNAELYAQSEYEANKFNDWIQEEDLLSWMVDMGIWTWDGDNQLKKIEESIDRLKVELYQSLLNPPAQKRIRRQLKTQKSLFYQKAAIRHSFDHITLNGYIDIVKNQYILLHSIYNLNDSLVFDYLDDSIDSILLGNISSIINENTVDMPLFRQIARNDVWKNYWSANKDNVFNKSALEMTDEQKTLTILTRMYDSSRDHPECPPDHVFDDDDMFDGWLILQRTEIEKSKNKTRNEKFLDNKKIGNAQEVFLMANTKEEAAAIYDLNDDTHKHIIKERTQFIDKYQEVKESELPDIKRDLQSTINEQFKNKFKK
jgi:hypothetical protein